MPLGVFISYVSLLLGVFFLNDETFSFLRLDFVVTGSALDVVSVAEGSRVM